MICESGNLLICYKAKTSGKSFAVYALWDVSGQKAVLKPYADLYND